jgi:hypothetical protein
MTQRASLISRLQTGPVCQLSRGKHAFVVHRVKTFKHPEPVHAFLDLKAEAYFLTDQDPHSYPHSPTYHTPPGHHA